MIDALLTSTLLSLLVIPVVFTYVDDLLIWLGQRFKRPAQPAAATASTPT